MIIIILMLAVAVGAILIRASARRRREEEHGDPNVRVVYVEKPRRRGGCLSTILIVLAVLVVIGAIAGAGKDSGKDSEKQAATKPAYVTDGIPGTSAYDVTVGLEDQGFGKVERKKTKDGYTFEGRCDNADGFYQYYILADDHIGADYEIRYAYFSFNGKNNNFLEACIDMTIGNGTASTARKSIQNLNEIGESKTNGTTYYYAPVGDNGGILEIASRSHENLIMREEQGEMIK